MRYWSMALYSGSWNALLNAGNFTRNISPSFQLTIEFFSNLLALIQMYRLRMPPILNYSILG